MNRNPRRILDFSEKMERLKSVQRKGWIRAGVRESESVADHSYACAMLAMIVGDLLGLDTELLIRMALLHDLPESVTGDLTPRQKKKLGIRAGMLEKQAAINAIAPLPSKMRRKYLALTENYRRQHSEESRLLKDLDKIEMSIQAIRYIREGYAAKNMVKFLKSAEKNLTTDIGRLMYEALKSGA